MPGFHHTSTFGDGPRVPFNNREDRAQFRALLKLRRGPGLITACTEDVGEALLAMIGRDGRLDPSHQHLAERAGCVRSVAQDGLRRLQQLGFIESTRRIERRDGRVRQRTNAYVLRVPGRLRGVDRCNTVFRAGVRRKIFSTVKPIFSAASTPRSGDEAPLNEAQEAFARAAAAGPDLLAAARAAFEARQRAAMAARA